jgi:hypothetical protein
MLEERGEFVNALLAMLERTSSVVMIMVTRAGTASGGITKLDSPTKGEVPGG